MSEPNVAVTGMLIGRIEVLERALLRTMLLLIAREPNQSALLKDLREDFQSFVLSLPMTPEEIQKHAGEKSGELLRQISASLQESGHIHSECSPTSDPEVH